MGNDYKKKEKKRKRQYGKLQCVDNKFKGNLQLALEV